NCCGRRNATEIWRAGRGLRSSLEANRAAASRAPTARQLQATMSLRPKTRPKRTLEHGCADCVEATTATRDNMTTMPTMPSTHSGLRVSTASTPNSKPAVAVPPFWARYQGISANRGSRVMCDGALRGDRLPACQQVLGTGSLLPDQRHDAES